MLLLTFCSISFKFMTSEVDEDGGVADDHNEERKPRQAYHVNHPPHLYLIHVFTTRRLGKVLPVAYLWRHAT